MKKIIFFTLLFIFTLLAIYQSPNGYLFWGYHRFFYTNAAYKILTDSLQSFQKETQYKFLKANKNEKIQILANSQQKIIQNILEMFNFWYGTDWDMNGTSQIPGEGKIACGYFVTTILRDAGFQINRIKLAQYASEKMIVELIHKKNIKRFQQVELNKILLEVQKMGNGLYLVGLDTHTGFLLCQNQELTFIHSTRSPPRCVIQEVAANSESLQNSAYKIIGKIDEKLMQKWLEKAQK